jgi:hypothetical protein
MRRRSVALPKRSARLSPVSSVHVLVVSIFGLLYGVTVGVFFRSTIGEDLLGTTIAVIMGSCACLGGIVWVMHDGMEPE